MSILAGFIGGASKQALGRLEKREDAELEMKKAEMLEQLRKETAKELAEFEENLPSAKLKREREAQLMKHADEDQVLERDRFGMEREGFELEKGYKALDYQYKAEDQAMQREDQQMQRTRLSLDRASHAESIANSRAQRARYAREDKEAAKSENILFREYESLLQDVAPIANEAELSNVQAAWYRGVNQDGGLGVKGRTWTKDEQRNFIAEMRNRFKRKMEIARERGEMPSQQKDLLGK